jgi:hypothetical protein
MRQPQLRETFEQVRQTDGKREARGKDIPQLLFVMDVTITSMSDDVKIYVFSAIVEVEMEVDVKVDVGVKVVMEVAVARFSKGFSER